MIKGAIHNAPSLMPFKSSKVEHALYASAATLIKLGCDHGIAMRTMRDAQSQIADWQTKGVTSQSNLHGFQCQVKPGFEFACELPTKGFAES